MTNCEPDDVPQKLKGKGLKGLKYPLPKLRMRYQKDPQCKSCGVPYTEHLGLIGTCARLKEAEATIRRFTSLHPIEDWDYDDCDVLWWKLPIEEPPYIGRPDEHGFPSGYTHWSRLPEVWKGDDYAKECAK